MPKKSQRIRNNNTLDLHSFSPSLGGDIEQEVFQALDKFMTPRMTQKNIQISIIVGKGLGSKKFINGKNPLRHYTEKYLSLIGCDWQEGSHTTGQEGVLNVFL
jgi:hypothetical protein